MRKLRFLSPSPLHPFQLGLFILIELLLILGKDFAKLRLFWHFHLYDFSLLLLAVISAVTILLRKKSFSVYWPLLLLLGISFAYLIYSLVSQLGPLNYILRHYALFAYLGCFYLIFAAFIDPKRNQFNIRFIALVGVMAVGLQVLKHLYGLMATDDYRLFEEFNQYSLLAIPGIIVMSGKVLVDLENQYLKYLLYAFLLFLSTTLGFSSAFLATFTVLFIYLILSGKPIHKIMLASVLVLSVIAFFLFLPQFQDYNAQWRILFWQDIIKEGIYSNYGVIGEGFGKPFMDAELVQKFVDELKAYWFDVIRDEYYLSPMHNSFLTMGFHIGFLPALLILFPLKKPFQYLLFRHRLIKDSQKDFMLLALVGVSVWAGFNVVLELPHSSGFYWLIYFSLVYLFSEK